MPFISFASPEGEPSSDLVHHFYVFGFCGHRIASSSNLSSTLVLSSLSVRISKRRYLCLKLLICAQCSRV